MPFVLITMGVVLLIAAVRGPSCGQVQCHQLLFYLLARDFTGPNNFIFWLISILIIGAIGYVPKLKPVSDGFLILIILVLLLKNRTGFFSQFTAQIGSTQTVGPQVAAGGSQLGPLISSYLGGGGLVNISAGGVGVTLPGRVGVGLPGGGSVSIGLPGSGGGPTGGFPGAGVGGGYGGF